MVKSTSVKFKMTFFQFTRYTGIIHKQSNLTENQLDMQYSGLSLCSGDNGTANVLSKLSRALQDSAIRPCWTRRRKGFLTIWKRKGRISRWMDEVYFFPILQQFFAGFLNMKTVCSNKLNPSPFFHICYTQNVQEENKQAKTPRFIPFQSQKRHSKVKSKVIRYCLHILAPSFLVLTFSS